MKSNKQETVDRIFFVIKVIIVGLVSGFFGMVAFAALNPPTDLYVDIRNALLAGFFSMTASVTVIIYRHNRHRNKEVK